MEQDTSKVDAFVDRATSWQAEIRKLRTILLGCGLDEALKWGKPCYSVDGCNVAIIQPFKTCCALMFFKGVLLDDSHGLLRSQGKNSQAALRLEFSSEAAIEKTIIQSFVRQAIVLEREGRRVSFAAKDEVELPEELTRVLGRDRKLAKAFRALTPGRQRGYVLHFTGAKKTETRSARIEKCIPSILAGKGFQDR